MKARLRFERRSSTIRYSQSSSAEWSPVSFLFTLLSAAPVPDPNLLFVALHSIEWNSIGDEGAAAIAGELKDTKTLKTLK